MLRLRGHAAAFADEEPAGPVPEAGRRAGRSLQLRAWNLLDRLHRHHPGSAAHSLRVAELTMAMWRIAATDPRFRPLGDAGTALLGSLLHDVGKLGVPRAVLASRAGLSGEALKAIRSHAARGAALLRGMGFPEAIASVARDHHERWSGGGYPSGRRAREQSPLARAVAVADAYDAMTDPDRGYRAPLGRDEALREVAACAGTHFDPAAAALLAEALGETREEAAEELDSLPWSFRRAAAAHMDLIAVH